MCVRMVKLGHPTEQFLSVRVCVCVFACLRVCVCVDVSAPLDAESCVCLCVCALCACPLECFSVTCCTRVLLQRDHHTYAARPKPLWAAPHICWHARIQARRHAPSHTVIAGWGETCANVNESRGCASKVYPPSCPLSLSFCVFLSLSLFFFLPLSRSLSLVLSLFLSLSRFLFLFLFLARSLYLSETQAEWEQTRAVSLYAFTRFFPHTLTHSHTGIPLRVRGQVCSLIRILTHAHLTFTHACEHKTHSHAQAERERHREKEQARRETSLATISHSNTHTYAQKCILHTHTHIHTLRTYRHTHTHSGIPQQERARVTFVCRQCAECRQSKHTVQSLSRTTLALCLSLCLFQSASLPRSVALALFLYLHLSSSLSRAHKHTHTYKNRPPHTHIP